VHEEDAGVEIPIEGVLDLHSFSPKEAEDLVVEYIEACMEHGIYEVRIIHGKGRGFLREKVHGVLRKLPSVVSFALASDSSGWGATMVNLKKQND